MLLFKRFLLVILVGASVGCTYATDFSDLNKAELEAQLLKAVNDGNLERFDALVAAGYAASYFGVDKTRRNKQLLEAVAYNRLDEAKYSLKYGADVDAIGIYGYTALIDAIWRRYPQMAQLLIDNGANFNASDECGNTALMIAAQLGYTEEVQLLLDNGADTTLQNNNGLTAMIMARNAEIRWMFTPEAMQARRWSPERSEWIALVDRAANPDRPYGVHLGQTLKESLARDDDPLGID